jgi:pimeloyl-ACP methyl ester carboxylesterase
MIRAARGLALLCGVLVASFGGVARAAEPLPRFDPIPCPFDVPEGAGADVRCGWLVVPEDRGRPEGRQLRLTVSILPAKSANPERDPVVYLSGGPGSAEAGDLGSWLDHPLREDRDLLLVDQRGTGPFGALCPDLYRQAMQVVARDVAPATDAARHAVAARGCRRSLHARGVDLAQYRSATSAADLRDLRSTLGYARLNLFGVSYGSRLALTAARDVPDAVRSMILISPLGPEMDFYRDLPVHLSRALAELGTDCAAAPACRAECPDFEAELAALLSELGEQPLILEIDDRRHFPGGRAVVNPQDLTLILGELASSDGLRWVVPALVRELRRGRSELLAPLLRVFASAYGGIDLGLYYAVQCQEELPFSQWGRPSAQPALALGRIGMIGAVREVCADWRLPPAGAIERAPVVSPIPALVLTGARDYKTPPAYAHALAASLPRGHAVVLPGKGHGSVRDRCIDAMVAQFVADPTGRPDASCASSLRSTPPVARVEPRSGALELLLSIRAGRWEVLAWLGLPLTLLATALFVVPIRWLRHRRSRAPLSSAALRAAVWLAALLSWAFTIALVVTVLELQAAERGALLLVGLPVEAAKWFALPKLAAVGGVVGLGCALAGWRSHGGSKLGRGYDLLAVGAALALATFWLRYGLL